MNLNHLYYFVKLAELEHYTNAAEELNLTQPSLSHAMASLEKELGTVLFEKQGRNVVLTKYGKMFLKYVTSSLETLEAGVKKTKGMTKGENGHIDLGFIYTLGPAFVPGLVRKFLKSHPDKDIEFGFHSNNTTSIIKGLKNEKYDVAFCSMRQNEDEIKFIPIHEEELVLIVPTDHELSRMKEVDLKDTVDYPFIAFSPQSGLRPVIDDLYTQIGKEPKILFHLEEDSALAGLVSEGFGIAIVPNIPILDHMNLKKLRIINPPYKREIYMAYMKERYMSPVVSIFCDYIVEQTKQR